VDTEAAAPLQQGDQAVLQLLEVAAQLGHSVDQQHHVGRDQFRDPAGRVLGPQHGQGVDAAVPEHPFADGEHGLQLLQQP
jgi:hypothetical protein